MFPEDLPFLNIMFKCAGYNADRSRTEPWPAENNREGGKTEMRLLLAEDEEAMADAIVAYLSYHQMTVDWFSDGLKAREAALMKTYDVMILDIMMPGMDGVTLLLQLRARGNTAPVIFLTAKSGLRDKVQGFEAGSDDYLTKPFAMEELLVRINALARRGRGFFLARLVDNKKAACYNAAGNFF